MDKRIIISAVVILCFVLLILVANQYLEIYPRKKQIWPSNEVYSNSYYTIEKWLNETGHPVRLQTEFTFPAEIAAIPEKAALVFAGACSWENADEYLLPWIEEGGSLILFIASNIHESDKNLVEFINGFGILAERTDAFSYYSDAFSYYSDANEDFPHLDSRIRFHVDDDRNKLLIKDEEENINFVQVSTGEGNFIIMGNPYFLQNFYLEKKANAGLAWEISGALTTEENPGVFFVRNQNQYVSESNPMFGKLMEKGNLLPVGISALLVIIFGFWMVVPVFGLVLYEKQKTSRPIKERFLAEIMFLKKYRALNVYIETYESELKTGNAPEQEGNYKFGELINKIRSVYDGTDKFKRGIRRIKT